MEEGKKSDLPNDFKILLLGISSIVFLLFVSEHIFQLFYSRMFFLLLSIAISIVTLVISIKPIRQYKRAPKLFHEQSYKRINAGRICALIPLSGIILFFLGLACIWFIFNVIL